MSTDSSPGPGGTHRENFPQGRREAATKQRFGGKPSPNFEGGVQTPNVDSQGRSADPRRQVKNETGPVAKLSDPPFGRKASPSSGFGGLLSFDNLISGALTLGGFLTPAGPARAGVRLLGAANSARRLKNTLGGN